MKKHVYPLSLDRREYGRMSLDESLVPADPFQLFDTWMEDAQREKVTDPTAMTLSTADSKGQASSRIVLLKGSDKGCFRFFSNGGSRKGQEIAANPKVAAHFHWPGLERQIKISGEVREADPGEAREYFHSRPRESQLAAWASQQSREIPDRATLDRSYHCAEKKFKGMEVDCPPSWKGYEIMPHRIEFWQGGKYRLHDRIEYHFENGAWSRRRLAP